MTNQLQLPSLGRPFNLGMLYDCRTEKLIPGITLWGSQKLKSASRVEKLPSSTCKVIAEDSIREKSTTLGVDANLKLSLMCGLVEVEGAANYLNDQKSSKKQSRVTLQYTSTTDFVQLTMDQIGAIEFPDVLDDQDATHVVTAIQYGADAFFVFDRFIEGAETVHDIHGKMEASIKCIPELTVSGGGSVSYKNVDKTETDKFHCTFHGDLILSSNPSSFEEAIKLYKRLPQLVTENGSVPKLVYLTPLTKLKKVGSQQIISAISFEVTSQVEKIMEQFHDTEMRINDLLNHDICSKFVDLKSQLKKLRDLVTRFKMSFIKDLVRILPKVRSAGEKEEKLADLIASVHASPFSSGAMGKHLCDKQNEINCLAQCLENAGKDPNILFDFPNTDCHLAKLKFDFNIDHIACFGFNVTSDTSPYIQNLEHYLQTGKAQQIDRQEWFNTGVATQLRLKLIQFIEFTKANASEKTVSYVITNADSAATERLPSLFMYSTNESKPFDPPGRPGKPEASNVTAKSVELTWTAPKNGGRVLFYRVKILSSKTTTKEVQPSTALATSLSISGLVPAVAYNCWVVAMGDCDSIIASELCHFETLEWTKETRKVLKEREHLETLIPKLQEQICNGMARMDEIKQEEAILRQHETDLNANKDFKYTIEVTAFRKVDLEPGIYTTTCQVCNFTCHKNCSCANDADKQKCCVMIDEKCSVCPGKCHWSEHLNVPYIFKYYPKKETRTSNDLKTRYNSAKRGKKSAKAMIAANEDKLVELHVEVHMLIKQRIERLREIALKPNPLTEVDYLDLLIESEQQEANTGWQDRVKKLKESRKDAELYQKVESGQFDSLGAIVQYDQRPSLLKRV